MAKYGRPPKRERLDKQLRIFMAQPVRDWLQAEANRRAAEAMGIADESEPRPQSPAPFVRELIAGANWLGRGADVRHDRRPSLLMLVSSAAYEALLIQLAAHPEYEDVSTLVYAYAVLPAALTAGVNPVSDPTEE